MTRTFAIKWGKSPDEMTFDECMAHIRRALFWDYVDGEWCDVVLRLSDKRWEELAGYIIGAHEREILAAKAETKDVEAENAKLREITKALWECCAWETDSEGWCEGCDHHDTEDGGCRLEKALRELGIGADA